MKKKINKQVIPMVGVPLTAVAILLLFLAPSKPHLTMGVIPGSNADDFTADSTFRENRHMGLVSLDKFVGLASQLGSGLFIADNNVKLFGDSVSITLSNTNKSDYFFGDFTNIGQIERMNKQYKDFPITIINEGTGFTAKVETIDNRRYIHIPYLVLTSLAKYVAGDRDPSSSGGGECAELPTINDDNIDLIINNRLDNKKIQTEGIVRQNFTNILAATNKTKNSEPVYQLHLVWEYVNEHWMYINDPNTDNGSDTWRSATETITDYYSNGKTYTGDCDDYAILMASFARQCGLESRLVCAREGNKGHMYAEFKSKNETLWHNLDWGMPFDTKERYGSVVKYINDL